MAAIIKSNITQKSSGTHGKSKSTPVTGYDKLVNWKVFILPVALFFLLLIIPTPNGMKDVGTEYAIGPEAVKLFIIESLFDRETPDAEQWQLLTAQVMEKNMRMGALNKARFLKRDLKWCGKQNIPADGENLIRSRTFIDEKVTEEAYQTVMRDALALRNSGLTYDDLTPEEKEHADGGAWRIKVSIAMAVFVVLCFLTECIPLPGVAFCVGLIVVFTGVISNEEVAMLYWSDACWFIMGSLMFAVALVKTGVDKRACLMMFNKLAVPSVRWITLIFFLVITPLAAFISDHALAAMFLPIGMLLYRNSLGGRMPDDSELGKMLMITIAMACNLGGPGAPSGGARNVIMMTYLNDMFGLDIGYFQWVTYCFPILILSIPVCWLLVNTMFKPKTHSLVPAMEHLKSEIEKMGGWNRSQIIALFIFVVMVFGWFTEKTFFEMGVLPFRIGIGVIAVAGAVAYLMAGIVSWRDYQQKVDWGVIWLYAGAIIFGRVLDQTGAAYWLARSVIEALAPLGMDSGMPLMAVSNGLTAIITNLMADGPAAAAVGPITLNIAGLVHPGTTYLPFMAMSTAVASSLAYCLIIGTPPNAIVYASGYLTPKDYLRVGIPMWFISNIFLLLFSSIYWKLRGFGELAGF